MGRPRDRKGTEGLLPRIEARPLKGGGYSYRYKPVEGKPIPLGRDKVAANRKVMDLIGRTDGHGTMQWLWEQFQNAKRWTRLADGTRADYELAWKQLAKTFSKVHASYITPPMMARYVNVERASAPRRAVIEKALASNLFRHGITLGVCTANPTVGIETEPSEPRTEAPDPAVLVKFLGWLAEQTPQRRIVGMAAEYASLAGSRKVEFLDLAWPQVDEAAAIVRTKRAKQRGKKRGEVIERVHITPKLRALLDRLKALRTERGVDCLYVFPTRDNNAYTARGFKTLWQRCVLDAIAAGVLPKASRFTFHDLRAYYTTVHKRERGALPDLHANPATTASVYDRNKEVDRSAL